MSTCVTPSGSCHGRVWEGGGGNFGRGKIAAARCGETHREHDFLHFPAHELDLIAQPVEFNDFSRLF